MNIEQNNAYVYKHTGIIIIKSFDRNIQKGKKVVVSVWRP